VDRVSFCARSKRISPLKTDPAETLTAVLSGELEARKEGRLLGRYAAGEFIGLGCIMPDAPEFCDATLANPARVMP
jgi:CRP-like cAMP-binding protein